MKRVFILHQLPLEFYPPITNFLNILDGDEEFTVQVFSTKNNKDRKPFTCKRISIFRTVYPAFRKTFLSRLWSYFTYFCFPLWRLIWFRPDSLVYFEPHSAMPAYLYKKFFNRKTKLIIHHHEYYASEDFNGPSMASVRFYHKLEVSFLFRHAAWISQTNSDRLSFFAQDNPAILPDVLKVLPNYPPQKWMVCRKPCQTNTQLPIKIVYVGSLSLEDTYVKEFCEWVMNQSGNVVFDIYAYNLSVETDDYLKSLKSTGITFYRNGVDYDDLPKVLSGYHVGVILYKAKTKNFRYNAPNKLFEYLALNLDVWFPVGMLGTLPYSNSLSLPKVIPIDYGNLEEFDCQAAVDRINLPQNKSRFYFEKVIFELANNIKN